MRQGLFATLIFLSFSDLFGQSPKENATTAEDLLHSISLEWGKTAIQDCDSISKTFYLLQVRQLLRAVNSELVTSAVFKKNLEKFERRYIERNCPSKSQFYSDPVSPLGPGASVTVMKKGPSGVNVKMEVPLQDYLLSLLNEKQKNQLLQDLDAESKQNIKAFWINETPQTKDLNTYFLDQKLWNKSDEENFKELFKNPEITPIEMNKVIMEFNKGIESPERRIDPKKIKKEGFEFQQ